MELRNLGIGALELYAGNRRLFIDAFNSINIAEEVSDRDIILFTHDDSDHFDADKLPDMKGLDISLIGPPSIIKPVLDAGKATLDQIIPLYSQNNTAPASIDLDEFSINCYRTSHFLDWKPIHNSYLLQHENCNIYITGDSYLTEDMKAYIGNIDVVICNLVDEGYITGKDDKRLAIHHHMSYLMDIISVYKPVKIVGIHLIDFDGTVEAKAMKKLVTDYGFEEIAIPESSNEIILI